MARLLERTASATNYGSWVDTTRWRDRDLTAEEGAAQLQRDLRLAKQLGLHLRAPEVRRRLLGPRPHPIWQETVERSLDLAAELDVVICPEIHTPTPIKHPVTQGYIDFIERTGTEHFRLLIDTGIFNTGRSSRSPRDRATTGRRSRRTSGRSPSRWPTSSTCCRTPTSSRRSSSRSTTTCTTCTSRGRDPPDAAGTAGHGWLSSEYEGRREPYRGRDQVRRQHALIRSLQTAARWIHPDVAARFPMLDGLVSMREAYGTAEGLERIRAYESWEPGGGTAIAVEVRDDVAPGPHGPVPVRVYEPPQGERTARPCLISAHGGGFLGGDLDMREADWTAREVCVRAGAVVVSVDYRLAVDGVSYPVPHDDTVAAICWVRDNADVLGIDTGRISVGGAIAGANLTAGAVLKLRDRDGSSRGPCCSSTGSPTRSSPPPSPALSAALAELPAILAPKAGPGTTS